MSCFRAPSRVYAAVLLLAGLTACTEQHNPTEATVDDDWSQLLTPRPGSRLRPIYRTADDGTHVHVGWHDSLLGAPCEFSEIEGVQRCVPDHRTVAPWLYADAGCTELVASPSDVPAQGTVLVEISDCEPDALWALGEPVTGDIYYDANGPCEPFGPSEGHVRVTAFAADGFVAATKTVADGDGRIVPMILEAEDGARQIIGAWDNAHGEEVAAESDEHGQLRWFGRWEPTANGINFADASCSQEAAIERGCTPSSATATTARQIDLDACDEVVGRFRLSQQADELWSGGNACDHADFSSPAWALGEPLASDDFAVAVASESGGSRLLHQHYATPEGQPILASRRFTDPQLDGAVCDFRDAGDGELFCRPLGAVNLSNSYLDPECTQQIAWGIELGCEPQPRYALGGPSHLADVTGVAPSWGAYALLADGSCAPEAENPPDGTSDLTFYRVGPTRSHDFMRAVDIVE